MTLLIVYQTTSSDALLTILGSQKLYAVKRMSQHCKVTSLKSFSGLTTTTCLYTKTSLSISPISTTGTTHSQNYLSFASSFSTGSQTLLCLDKPSNFEILVLQWPLIYLGVWTHYILDITSKAREKAAWVLSVFRSRSPEIMPTLYKSMIRSLLEYCCPLWSPTQLTNIQELENVQNIFTTKIAGMSELNYWKRL